MNDEIDEDEEPVDVALETLEGDVYQFLSVSKTALLSALTRAITDEVTFSIVNLVGGALVVPWRTIRRVLYISIYASEDSDVWELVWDKDCVEEEPAPG